MEDRSVPATISGYAFLDLNANGLRDPGEGVVAGVGVGLTPTSSAPLNTQTDGAGYYAFTGLAPDSYTLRATPPAGYGVTTPPGGTATINIATDADAVGVGIGLASSSGSGSGLPVISMTPVNVREGSSGDVVFTRTGGDQSQPLTVAYTIGGTATPGNPGDPGADYQTLSGTVTFGPGSPTVAVTIAAFTDGVYDPDETVALTIYPTSQYVLADNASSAMASNVILDVPPPPPTPLPVIAMTPSNTTEGGTATVTFTLVSGALTYPLTVTYDVSGTATPGDPEVPGSDYQPLSGSVTFDPGVTTAVVPITSYHDAIYDPDETVALTIYPTSTYTLADGAVSATAVAVIMDDGFEAPDILTWSDPDQNLVEGTTATVTLQVWLASVPTADVLVSLSPDDQLTVSNSSLIFTPSNWDIPQAVTVSVVEDAVAEGFHYGIVDLSASSADSSYDGLSTSWQVGIVDNDGPSAIDDAVETNEDSPVTFGVLVNDVSPRGGPLTVAGYTQPGSGRVALNPDSTFTYTPAANWFGTTTFTYSVSDGTLTSNTATVAITVDPVEDPPVLTAPGPRTDREDTPIDFAVSATDPDGDPLLLSATGLPPGVTLDPATGEISGWINPGAAGQYTTQITADDGAGGTATAPFSWTVTRNNHAPFIIPSPPTAPFTVGQVLNSLTLFSVEDADNDPLTITVAGLPSWLVVDSATGTVSGTIQEAGPVTVTVTADDGNGGVASSTFVLLVAVDPSRADAPAAYFTTPGPLATFTDPATPLTLTVAFRNPADPVDLYAVDVTVRGNGTVDRSVLNMRDGDTTTITYTPGVVSQAYNDITVALLPHLLTGVPLPAPTGVVQITTVDVTFPTIRAADTPAGMADRVSLGKDTAGQFTGTAKMSPAMPAGKVSIEINKPTPDIKYGDIGVAAGVPDKDGNFKLTVWGINPTLPSTGPDGKPDYKAGNRNGLGLIARITNPGMAPIDGKKSNMFSVATIPIGVTAASGTEYNGGVVSGNPNFHLIGIVYTLNYVYDGNSDVNNNYVGEWLGVYNFNTNPVTIVDSSTNGFSNSNTTLSLSTSFTDANGVGRTAELSDYNFQKWASSGAVDIVKSAREAFQIFTFLNSAVDNVTAYNPSNTKLNVPAAIGSTRYVIKSSYFQFTVKNYWKKTGDILTTTKYYVRVTRSTQPPLVVTHFLQDNGNVQAGSLAAGVVKDDTIGYFEWTSIN